MEQTKLYDVFDLDKGLDIDKALAELVPIDVDKAIDELFPLGIDEAIERVIFPESPTEKGEEQSQGNSES